MIEASDKPEVPRRGVAVFVAITSLYWVSLYVFVPILAPYVEYSGGTLSITGVVLSAYGFAQILLRIPVGIVSDRSGRRKPFLAFGFIACMLASLGFVVAPGPWFMLVARLMHGCSASAWVAFSVFFASYYPPRETVRAMGYLTICQGLSVMASSFIGGRLADLWGWTAPFWASAFVALVGLLALGFVKERVSSPAVRISSFHRLRSVLGHRDLVLASAVAVLTHYVIFSTIFGFLPTYAQSIGASKTELGILTMLGTLSGSVVSYLTISWIYPRLGPRITVVLGQVGIGGATVVIPFLEHIGPLYISQIVSGFGRGAAYPVLMSLAIRGLPNSDRATAMGFFQAVYAVGMFSGPIASGWIGSYTGYSGLFFSVGAVAGLNALVALCLPRRDESKR